MYIASTYLECNAGSIEDVQYGLRYIGACVFLHETVESNECASERKAAIGLVNGDPMGRHGQVSGQVGVRPNICRKTYSANGALSIEVN
jgi:hypothetical protein